MSESEFSDNDRIAYCGCGFFWTVPTGMPWRDCENCDETPIDLIGSYRAALAQQEKAEELTSKVLDLEHECREASATEIAAIDRARKVERQMLKIRERLQSDDLAREVADALHVDGTYSAKPASFRAQREATIRPILSTAEILLTRDAVSCVDEEAEPK